MATKAETLKMVLKFLTDGEECRVLRAAGKPERHFFPGDRGGVDAARCPACALRSLIAGEK